MGNLTQIVLQAREGDGAAFEELVHRFQDMAVGYAVRILNDFQLAEDAAQDAFIEAFRVLPQLKEPSADAALNPGLMAVLKAGYQKGAEVPRQNTNNEHADLPGGLWWRQPHWTSRRQYKRPGTGRAEHGCSGRLIPDGRVKSGIPERCRGASTEY